MKIEFSTSSNPGTVPQEADGRLINALVEKNGETLKWIRQPGITEWATSVNATFRGMAYSTKAQILYVAYADILNKVTSVAGGAMATVGALSGTGRARFAFNQALTPDQIVVTELGMSTFTDVAVTPGMGGGAAPPALPIDICFVGGYFFFITADGRCFNSGINDAVFAGTFTTAEGKPDGLLRCLGFQDNLYLLGQDSIEVWGKPTNLTGFPFNRITMIPRGIAGPDCVTGIENGIDLGLIIVSGNNQVMRVNGYTPERISTPDVERDIAELANKTTIEMTSFVSDGHMYVKVRSPVWCWLYDLTTGTWVERQSYLSDTSRALQAVSAFNTLWVVGDSASGNLGKVNAKDYTEYGNPLIWECWSKRPDPFPTRTVVGPAYFNFVPGQGEAQGIDPIQTTPRVNISWSDDGGMSFVPFRIAPLNRMSVTSPYTARVHLTGSTGPYGRIWKVRISDPVYISFHGGEVPKISRRAVA
jgi:hypothetical protein